MQMAMKAVERALARTPCRKKGVKLTPWRRPATGSLNRQLHMSWTQSPSEGAARPRCRDIALHWKTVLHHTAVALISSWPAPQVHRALVKHTGEEVAVKLVDLEKLDAKLVWGTMCSVHAHRPRWSRARLWLARHATACYRHDPPGCTCAQELVIQEVIFMKRTRHPNILELHTAFVDGATLWMVIPLVPGGSLETLLQKGYRKARPAACARAGHCTML